MNGDGLLRFSGAPRRSWDRWWTAVLLLLPPGAPTTVHEKKRTEEMVLPKKGWQQEAAAGKLERRCWERGCCLHRARLETVETNAGR